MEPADFAGRTRLAGIARSLNACTCSGEYSAGRLNSFRVVEIYAGTAAERGGQVPRAYEEARQHAGPDRGRR